MWPTCGVVRVAFGAIEPSPSRTVRSTRRMTTDAQIDVRNQNGVMIQERRRIIAGRGLLISADRVAVGALHIAMRLMIKSSVLEPNNRYVCRCDAVFGCMITLMKRR